MRPRGMRHVAARRYTAAMRRAHRKEIVRTEAYNIHIIGAPVPGLRDLYHDLLRVPWWAVLLIIAGAFLALNCIFAALYVWVGGIAHARPGSFADAFFFSVQTMGTIGYGTMYPATNGANALVVAESVVSLVTTALATGLVFVRFSQTRAQLMFSKRVAIGPMDGVPTLMLRVGNVRKGNIVGAEFRMTFTCTSKTAEGMTIYRLQELKLVRTRAPALSRSWTVLHQVVDGSPLAGFDAQRMAAVDAEISVEVVGTDETSLQPVHARHTWFAGSVAWGSRLADVLSETPEGDVILDLRNFHEVIPVA
jgi:inward rectifier potassium channel